MSSIETVIEQEAKAILGIPRQDTGEYCFYLYILSCDKNGRSSITPQLQKREVISKHFHPNVTMCKQSYIKLDVVWMFA